MERGKKKVKMRDEDGNKRTRMRIFFFFGTNF